MNSTYNCSFQHIIGFLGVRPWASWKIKVRSTWEIEKSLGYFGVFRKDRDSYGNIRLEKISAVICRCQDDQI